MDARILIMDEPTSSLFEDAAEKLFRLMEQLKQRGAGIVYVSYKMDEIFQHCRSHHGSPRRRERRHARGRRDVAGGVIRLMVGRELKVSERAGRHRARCCCAWWA